MDEPEEDATVTDSPAANRRGRRSQSQIDELVTPMDENPLEQISLEQIPLAQNPMDEFQVVGAQIGTLERPLGKENNRASDPLVNRRTPSTIPPTGEQPSLKSVGWSDPRIAGSAIETRTGEDDLGNLAEQNAARQQQAKQALFTEDVALMRTFSLLIAVLCFTLVVVIPFLNGNAMLRAVLWGGALFSIFTSLWVIFTLRDVSKYDQNLINVMALLSVSIVYAGVLYLGVHSPAPLLILSGLYFVARSQSRLVGLAMYLTCAIMQGSIALLILTDTIVDPGLLRAEKADFEVRIIIQGLIQMSYLGTYILAHASRVGTLVAMEKVVEAERTAQQREAAFIEVRADLDRALAAGGLGHYSNQILGNFKLGGIIGRGAMGEVYDAVHVETGQLAAAKLLHPHVLAKQSSVHRFLREAKAASALRSPHSVLILDSSDISATIPYLMMERLVGFDLAHHLREVGRLELGDVITLCEQIGKVIDMAAAQGIVHRDLKPQNLFLAESTTGSIWKLLDFGASKLAEHQGTLTQGRVIGTPAYMSPQQARGQDVDGAADRYCLAAIAYRSLTGRAPFSGKDLPTTLFNVVYGTPPQPSIVADLDPDIDIVLAIGMAKKPMNRFASGVEFARALESAGNGTLSPALQKHGNALLTEAPWGMQPEKN